MWLAATLIAAVFQIARTAMQQKLRPLVGVNAAGFVRYAFGAPLALAAVVVASLLGNPLPPLNTRFLLTIAVAGVAQIAATIMLIRSFELRDFAIGTAYSKTESLQVAGLSAVVLSEPIALLGWLGIAVSLVGVVVLAARGDRFKVLDVLRARGDRAMWTGIAAGAGFAVAATCIRSASKALGVEHPIVRALVALLVMNTIQTVLHGTYLWVRKPQDLAAVRANWRSSAVVGALSVGGSAGWAIAMTLHNAAIVRAVGQIDLVFALLVGRFVFREERLQSEYVASALVAIGVVLVLLS